MSTRAILMLWAIFSSALYWAADAAIDAYLFGQGPFWSSLVSDVEPHELYMRSIVPALFLATAFFGARVIEKRNTAEEAVLEQEQKYRMLFNCGDDAVFVARMTDGGSPGRFVEVNNIACDRLGFSRDELLALSPVDIDPKSSGEGFEKRLGELHDRKHGLYETVHVAKDGSEVPVEVNVRLLDYCGEQMMFSVARDITERKRAEQEYKSIIRAAMDGFWMTDKYGRFLDVNDAYCRLVGYTRDELLKMRIGDLEAEENPDRVSRHIQKIIRHGSDRFRTKHRCKDGRIIDVEISVNYSEDGGGRFIVFLRDITERMMMERALKKLSQRDGLTGLINRRHFDDAFGAEWRRSAREGLPVSVIMADVDNFKHYNDTYGHQGGDSCLKSLADIMKDMAKRPGDVVARYGGEEFIAMFPDTGIEGALAIANTLREDVEAMNIPHRDLENRSCVTMSIGVASVVPTRELPPETLVKQADQALYRAKERGRNCVVHA